MQTRTSFEFEIVGVQRLFEPEWTALGKLMSPRIAVAVSQHSPASIIRSMSFPSPTGHEQSHTNARSFVQYYDTHCTFSRRTGCGTSPARPYVTPSRRTDTRCASGCPLCGRAQGGARSSRRSTTSWRHRNLQKADFLPFGSVQEIEGGQTLNVANTSGKEYGGVMERWQRRCNAPSLPAS